MRSFKIAGALLCALATLAPTAAMAADALKSVLVWDPRFPGREPMRVTITETAAAALVQAGVATPADSGDYGYLAGLNQKLAAQGSTFPAGAGAGQVASGLTDPFAGKGLGTTSYTTFGTVPGQLGLSGNQIVSGAALPLYGRKTYAIGVEAISGDGSKRVGETLTLTAKVQLPGSCTAPPALPLAAGAKIVWHGDSIGGLGLTSSNATNSVTTRMSSIMETAWADNPNFTYENWYDPSNLSPFNSINPWAGGLQGIAGDHLDWGNDPFGNGILNRTLYSLARGPALVILQGGGNSINSGDDMGGAPAGADYVIGKLDATINQFTCRGVWVVLMTLLPDGFWPPKDPRHETLRQVNTWIRAQAGRAGVKILDPYNSFVDPGDPDKVIQALYQENYDPATQTGGVHPNQAGAWLLYRDYLKPLLAQMIAPGSVLNTDPTVGNIAPATTALMNGTGTGTLSAGGTNGGATPVKPTGAAPQGWTVNAVRGSSASSVSVDTSQGSYNRLVLSVTPANDGYTGPYHEIDITPSTQTFGTPVPAGSWVQAWVHVETPATGVLGDGPSTLMGTWTVYNAANTVLAANRAQAEFTGIAEKPNFGRGGYWLRFPPILVPAAGPATKSAMSLIVLFPKSNLPFTVKVDRLIIRQVADPRPTWNLP
ncbi:SGNH/GDSL hydrolase family protein [Sphingomonas morindae]|uniref:SGNH/GDSL hydrolase family protein n=1 Tax=Sphingomonas morindae TaxID=1541170 RepID=A0ABY4X3Y8_9SPHN|nr:SGNH/GDSL hydrolase family protein [Sphingomonas morindae]USI71608.1 SGNH/GDSL hydrolase family protein [Sphingomonas morindae]